MLLKILIWTLSVYLSVATTEDNFKTTIRQRLGDNFPKLKTDVSDVKTEVEYIDSRLLSLEQQDVAGQLAALQAEIDHLSIDCGQPPERESAAVHYTTTMHGAVAEYYCTKGYEYDSGSGVSQCSRGQWSEISLQCKDKCPINEDFVSETTPRWCFKLSGYSDVVNYATAKDSCILSDGRLLVVDSSEKYDYLKSYLDNLGWSAYQSGVSRYRIWMGMEKVTVDGEDKKTFLWNNGGDYVKIWEPGEPDWHIAQDCVQFLDEGMSDIYCYESRRYMCEIPMD